MTHNLMGEFSLSFLRSSFSERISRHFGCNETIRHTVRLLQMHRPGPNLNPSAQELCAVVPAENSAVLAGRWTNDRVIIVLIPDKAKAVEYSLTVKVK